MYYLRQEARQVALRSAARQSDRAFGLALAVRSAGLAGFQRSGIITGDPFRVRELCRSRSLSCLGNYLRRVVRTRPPVSVAVSGDRYSVGYSVARVAGPHSYRLMRRELAEIKSAIS